MALNAQLLGQALDEVDGRYNDMDVDINNLAQMRSQRNFDFAQAIIDHFTQNGEIPAFGLAAPNGPVTGTAKIQ